ncbi:MAG: hypothetical protein ACYST6_07010 [Planctomycetota bacterium]|jgi:hypothetical protein
MKRFAAAAGIIAFLFCAALAEGRETNRIRVQLQIFKFGGVLGGEVPEDESIWTTDDKPDRYEDTVTVFSRGTLELGKDRLAFKDGGCFWNEKEIPIDEPEKLKLDGKAIRLVYAPRLEMDEHDDREVQIRSEQPIQYFEKREDGLFELKQIKLATGLDLEDIEMTLRTVARREKVPGVNLAVGKPILGEQEYDFFFRVRPGKDYGIIISPERGRGGLLIRLRASSTYSGTLPKSKSTDKEKT